jgi:hypothetical protein
MTRLLEEVLEKIKGLSETDQNLIALDLMRSLDRFSHKKSNTPKNSLALMLRVPILEDEELDGLLS